MGSISISAEFSYQPLRATREIRLLRVLPGKGTDDICCTIHSTNLDSCPKYEALSYTWGDAKSKINIRCDGKALTVTRNLDSALRALRFANDTRVLWVDAVCINQKDLDEKNAQVAMMRDIYRKAQRVVAWVGEENHKDKAALDVGKYLDIPSKAKWSSPEEILTWHSLPTFVKRPWFSRIWIVQELAVAERLTIYCGQRQLEWDILRRGLIKFLDRTGLYLNTSKADVSLERVYTLLSIRNLVTEHLQEQQEPEGQFHKFQLSRIDDDRNYMEVKAGDLLHFVKGTRLFGSSNPSDHIFALLGLVLQEDRKRIVIDYSPHFSVVYREFARAMIVQHGTLDVLSQAGLHSTLPSWVPDWSKPPQCYPLNMEAYSASGNTHHYGGYRRFESMRREGFQEMLTLRGRVLDRIESLTPGFIVSDTVESEAFERTALILLNVLFPVVAIARGKDPLGLLRQIPSFALTRTVRITPELENQWFRAAQLCKRAYSSEQGLESVYVQTLIGNLPFKQLGSSHEALTHDCFLIWRERLSENPLVSRHGVFSSVFWTGKTKTGAAPAKVRPELKELFSLHQTSYFSEGREKFANKGMVQANSNTEFPVYVNKHLYEAVRSNDNTSGTAVRKDDMSIVMHDDASVKLGVARMFSRAVERMARNRQFCRTEVGSMGWVPLEAVRGDVICVLEAGRLPYVLRPAVGGNGRYGFVGEAYIHGLMNGEGWTGEMGEISLI